MVAICPYICNSLCYVFRDCLWALENSAQTDIEQLASLSSNLVSPSHATVGRATFPIVVGVHVFYYSPSASEPPISESKLLPSNWELFQRRTMFKGQPAFDQYRACLNTLSISKLGFWVDDGMLKAQGIRSYRLN